MAVELTRRWNGSLVLARATDPFVVSTPEMPSLTLRFQEQAQVAAGVYLEETAKQVTTVPVETRSLMGPPRDVIPELAATTGCQLIVMASHGRKGLARWFLGSVAESVLRQSHCPVLLLRPDSIPQPPYEFHKIMVPVDGSDSSLRVLQEVKPYLAEGGKVVVLRASGLALQDHAQLIDPAALENFLSGLEDQLSQLEIPGLELEYRVVDGEAADAILTLSEEMGCDLIAMSTHGRTGLNRFLLGSVTEKVARHAKQPLLAFPVAR